MDFENRLKRELSQGVFKCLLEDCGYRVIPLGIEAVIREIACLNKEAYKNLDFSDAVRFLPASEKSKFLYASLFKQAISLITASIPNGITRYPQSSRRHLKTP